MIFRHCNCDDGGSDDDDHEKNKHFLASLRFWRIYQLMVNEIKSVGTQKKKGKPLTETTAVATLGVLKEEKKNEK